MNTKNSKSQYQKRKVDIKEAAFIKQSINNLVSQTKETVQEAERD